MSNPSVNQALSRYEQIACRFTLILVVSKPRHAHGDAQLERRLLAHRNRESAIRRLLETKEDGGYAVC